MFLVPRRIIGDAQMARPPGTGVRDRRELTWSSDLRSPPRSPPRSAS